VAKSRKANSVNKSALSPNPAGSQKSLASSKSKDKSAKHSESGTKNVKLTDEVLHPEKFLFERRRIHKDLLMSSEGLMDLLREEHSKKEVREAKLNAEIGKS
jgi:hypothetical protein